jgi:hypothetical protein
MFISLPIDLSSPYKWKKKKPQAEKKLRAERKKLC